MVNMRQALGVDDFNQMSNYTGQLQNQRRSVGQKQYGLGGKVLDMAAALGDAYNQYQPPETALGMMALPAKAVYGLGNMIVQDVGDKTKSIMGTDRSNPAAMDQAATDAFGLAADTMAGGGVVSRMTDMPQGVILGANVFQGGPHKYGPEGAADSLNHMSKGEGAQAYGWGRYDAEAEKTGDIYKKQTSDWTNRSSEVIGDLPDRAKSRDNARALLTHINDALAEGDIKTASDYTKVFDVPDDMVAAYKKAADVYDSEGYLYKHDLPDEDIARYLDWDAPLSEQPESVRKILTAYQKETGGSLNQGKQLLNEISFNLRMAGKDDSMKAVSEELQKLGIPGLKYFDGMSRPASSTKSLIEAAGSQEAALANARKRFDSADADWGPMADDHKRRWADAIRELEKPQTRNFVTWDQDVLNRMKLLERNNEDMTKALMPK